MAKIKASAFKFKEFAPQFVEVEFQLADESIITFEVAQQLPLLDKIVMIDKIVRDSVINGIIRQELLQAYFDLQIAYSYTNIDFPKTLKEKDGATFDVLSRSGLIDVIKNNIPEHELLFITSAIDEYTDQLKNALTSSVSGYVAQEESMKAMLGNFIQATADKVDQ